jgi:hypothetical protein
MARKSRQEMVDDVFAQIAPGETLTHNDLLTRLENAGAGQSAALIAEMWQAGLLTPKVEAPAEGARPVLSYTRPGATPAPATPAAPAAPVSPAPVNPVK